MIRKNNTLTKSKMWLGIGLVMGFSAGYKFWRQYKSRQTSPLLRGEERLWAAVIGASDGIGSTFSYKFAAMGYNLILVSQHVSHLEQLAEAIASIYQVKVQILAVEMATSEGLEQVETLIANQAKLNILVNNLEYQLGRHPGENISLFDDNWMHRQIGTSLRLLRAVLPGMLAQKRGAIINVSTQKPYFPFLKGSSSSYLNALTHSLHKELEGSGVRVQTLSVGLAHLDIHRSAAVDSSTPTRFAWSQPTYIVNRSIRDLANDKIVSKPAFFYRLLDFFEPYIPHSVLHKLSRILSFQDSQAVHHEEFRKRTWNSLSDFANDIQLMMRHISYFQDIKELDRAFVRRLFLVVTYVNDCRYCAAFHTITAQMNGIPAEEIKELLSGIVDNVPEDELPALLYAQYWAEEGGQCDADVRQNMVDRYGKRKTLIIDSVLQMIKIGNYAGNAVDYIIHTISGGRWGNATH